MGVIALDKATDSQSFGGKAANLAKMLQSGLPVPNGLAVGLDAFDNAGKLLSEAKQQISSKLQDGILYAVRSSALAEDAEDASWAGLFETFLNTKPSDVCEKVEACHGSIKTRAAAYAADKSARNSFDIAVVIQEMVRPEYAGVLFTINPVTGQENFVAEYVEGLGEELVSGRADPTRITWDAGKTPVAPFDVVELTSLAKTVQKIFGSPQDIEWAYADGKLWLVQARPITTTAVTGKPYHLGEPDGLFYWGPSRAIPLYMSDFMAGIEHCFPLWSQDNDIPSPPKTLVLFHDGKMVWLNDAAAFGKWTEQMFTTYEAQERFKTDYEKWGRDTESLKSLSGQEFNERLVEAWVDTEFAEFSLYGSESLLAKRLERFDDKTRQRIWGAFTAPEELPFLNRIDRELQEIKDPEAIASKYPWIEDGYSGPKHSAKAYFTKRLEILEGDPVEVEPRDRESMAKELELTTDEVAALTLARDLAQFMDERKAWMMQTRRLITEPLSKAKDGWFYNDGSVLPISAEETEELWQRYVNFKSSTGAVKGMVASNGGHHFIHGEVVVVSSPTDNVEADKILVVPSTSPSYVPLMRKAKALITDHGGMMSHAAIVAREFGLPCIVGTKQATKVLLTGDSVVLDLVTGEVSK